MASPLPPPTKTVLKHYARLARLWPTDKLRPISFRTSLRKRLQARFLAPTASASPSDTVSPTSSSSSSSSASPTPTSTSSARQRATQTASNVQGTGAPSSTATSPLSEKLERVARMTPAQRTADEMEQVNALYSLLENRYRNTYACSEKLLRPGFKEGYYEELAREMEEAPTRSWWMQKWIRWRGIVRLS